MMKDPFSPDVAQQRAMTDYIIGAVVRDATGEAEGDRCINEPPSVKYYLGTLAPRDADLTVTRERRGREAPTSLGFEFEVADPAARLTVRGAASCYYRVYPTWEEQLAFSGLASADLDQTATYRLAPVFRRLEVDTGPIPIVISEGVGQGHYGAEEFAAAFAEAQERAAAESQINRRAGDDRKERLIPASALASAAAFDQWKGEQPGAPVVPTWAARITTLWRPVPGSRTRVTAMLQNLSTDPVVARTRAQGFRHDDERDHFLFRARLEVRAEAAVIVPIMMDLGPDAYRYNPELPAYATNCGVEQRVDAIGETTLFSVPAPVYETSRVATNPHAATRWESLAQDPIPLLKALAADMERDVKNPDWGVSELAPEMAQRKLSDRDEFLKEVARFKEGCRWLEKDERLLLAFKLANRTMSAMARMTQKRHDKWHLFQLVFIVSQLPSLAWREHPPSEFPAGLWGSPDGVDPTAAVTVLWFPTGGGKTEAYLGLMACAMFYDRARGKKRGVTAWCRFPLRLLSLQQTQRQVEFVAAADTVRRECEQEIVAAGGDVGNAFEVGFYVGEGNTPNSLSRDSGVLERLISDPARRREVRVVDKCPYCGESRVELLAPDPSELRLRHRCEACGAVLPVVVVDTELYRYLPSLVVGTLDKLAMIGLSDRFGALLGDADCECTIHGLGRGMKCHERRASGHPRDSVVPLAEPLYDASPSLEILDELHMVDEELGAFTGHYEGLLAHQQVALSSKARGDGRGVRMKVIATTATIRGEDRQCEHLFGLDSVVFPLPGPSLSGSFYWTLKTGSPLRRFVGILPHRSTAEFTLVRILESIHLAVRRAEDAGPAVVPGLSDVSGEDFAALLDLYRVSLTYVTSKLDFGKLRRSMDTQVNEFLRRMGVREVKTRDLSADTPFGKVREALDDLKTGGDTEAVIATSMISHGVDVDRLNVMVFNGMPKSIAEYIQASSRIGRSVLGCVFMIFNPVRERDRSHFRYHSKFHEYLDRMVAPVAINRWSRYAARRSLPGALMGEILQNLNREYWDAGRAPGHLHNLVHMQSALKPPEQGGIEAAQAEGLLAAMNDVYRTDWEMAAELRDEISASVEKAVSSIRAAGAAAGAFAGGRPQYRGTGDHLGLDYEPMTSLRDIAEGIPFFVLPERRRP